ncbi:MAG: TrkH family potassium uptake protein [Hyphomicrobiales bacterium]
MIDLRPIILVVGVLSSFLGVAMFIPAIFDLVAGNDEWRIFVTAGLITILIGSGLYASARGDRPGLSLRQAFLMSVITWIVLGAFGALPFYWSNLIDGYTNAFFESISALTTTGATIMTGLDDAPPGILLWRAILQWIGGLGIIVMAVSVLPMLQVGGMQVFKAEAFDTAEKILPSATQISGIMTAVYSTLTLTCAISYSFAGMSPFDALVHAMTTVATGGFSTRDASIGAFENPMIDMVAVVFMILGSLPFLLYIKVMQGHGSALFKDSQVRTFLLTLLGFIAIITALQITGELHFGFDALRHAAFNVVSIMTGTGYATKDYVAWGPFSTAVFFLLMFVGGCAGSTSCGIKIFRWQVLFEDIKQHINSTVFPNGVFVKRFNGQILPDSVSIAVMGFFFLYMLCFAILAALLSLTGLDTITALSGAASAISNVGPGLGLIIGPDGHYGSLSDTAKWLLGAGMLLGRLELFTVLVLLSPAFWRV